MSEAAERTRTCPQADEVIAIPRAHEAELRASGVRRLSLFGSVARGDAGPDSDMDLAVELDREARIDTRPACWVAAADRRTDRMQRRIWFLSRSKSNDCRRTSRGIVDPHSKHDPNDCLTDIIGNADRVAGYVMGMDQTSFARNGLVCDASERCVERIVTPPFASVSRPKRRCRINLETTWLTISLRVPDQGHLLRDALTKIEPGSGG